MQFKIERRVFIMYFVHSQRHVWGFIDPFRIFSTRHSMKDGSVVCVEQRKTKFRRGKFSYKEISLRKQVDE
jgi:hypothetical protein